MIASPRMSIFEDLKSLLEFYQALGIERIPFPVNRERAHGSINSEKKRLLQRLKGEVSGCIRCGLSKQRNTVVFGEGDPDARIMFIGEAPGKEEDLQGIPFVGEAGMLLTRLIEKMGFRRDDVYIANIIKCRPPMNRDPSGDEVETCREYIEKQIDIIQPDVIIALGRIALQSVMRNPKLKITAVRGNFLKYRDIPVMPTFHPAYLLRNPKDKWLTWNDVQKVLERLNVTGH